LRCAIGDFVIVTVNGRVAEKDRDGKLTGKMISFKNGDMGRIVSVRGSKLVDKVFVVALQDGMVTFRANSLGFPCGEDVALSREALQKSHPDYQIRDGDKGSGVDYD